MIMLVMVLVIMVMIMLAMIAGCSVQTTSGSSECHSTSSLFGNDPKLHDSPGMSVVYFLLMIQITVVKVIIAKDNGDEKCSQ